jgi:hypothetical protein
MAGNPITSFSGFNLLFYNDNMRTEGFGRNPHENCCFPGGRIGFGLEHNLVFKVSQNTPSRADGLRWHKDQGLHRTKIALHDPTSLRNLKRNRRNSQTA